MPRWSRSVEAVIRLVRLVVLGAAGLALGACVTDRAADASAPACAVDREALLALPYEAFDQDLEGGWRPLGQDPACFSAAASILRVYRERHAATLSEDEARGLGWHEGQMLAAAGQTEAAIAVFEELSYPQTEYELYREATIAFLARDRARLLATRDRLAALPESPSFAQTAQDFQERFGFRMTWPPNLSVIDGLIACYEGTYWQAYTGQGCPTAPGDGGA